MSWERNAGIILVAFVLISIGMDYIFDDSNLSDNLNEKTNINPILFDGQASDSRETTQTIETDAYKDTDELHWNHMPIRYYIYWNEIENTAEGKLQKKIRSEQITDAIARLHSNVPSITMEEVFMPDEADITYHFATEFDEENKYNKTKTAGEMLSWQIENVYVRAEIYIDPFGRSKYCTSSDLVLHETLHAFNIQHDKEMGTLMSESTWEGKCENYPMTKTQVDYLKTIYGDEESLSKEIL